MKIKRIHTLGILSIAIVLCVIGWFLLQLKEMEPVVIYKAVTPESRISEQTSEQKEAPEQKRDVNDTQWARDALIKNLEERKPEDTPDKIAYKKALESPAFAEYQKQQNANFPSFDLTLWWNFLESQGLSSGRMAQEEMFREHFPTGEYGDYDSMMRKRLAEIFLEMGSPDSTSEEDIEYHTIAGMMEFRKNEAQRVWMRGRFNGYKGDLEWANSIRQNAASIVAEADPAPAEPEPIFTETELTDAFSSPTEITEENLDSEQQNALSREEASSLEGGKQIPRTLEEFEEQPTEQLLPEGPELPTNAAFERALRERFSLQRFNRAMQTLNQYGLQEGLRRLKAADPEVAAQIERLIQPKKDNN